MKKVIITLFVLFLTTLTVNARDLNFAIVSDVHLKPSNNPDLFTQSEKNLMFTVSSINKNKDIKFVVFLGDNIDKSNIDSLESFMNIVKNLNKPYYMVYGNHDAYSVSGVDKEEFSKIMHSYNKKQPKKDTSFYFKADKNAYGLVLDGSSYAVPGKHGRYLPELLNQAEKLFKHKKKSMILIFQHFPLVAPNDNVSHETLDTDKYLDLISKYKNIVLIASGHFHHKKLTVDDNNIYHISAPALGARASSDGSGCYETVNINYSKKPFMKPNNIKIIVTDVKI